jgi:ketosteroid isomerase-like protein
VTADPAALLDEFRRRQQTMYAGGEVDDVAALLSEDVVWHVPGASPIAGDHRGRAAVLDYFRHRRGLAGATMRMHVRSSLVDRDTVAEFTDGSARIDEVDAEWRTLGVYRFRDGLLAEAWLVPLELDAFDAIWSAG